MPDVVFFNTRNQNVKRGKSPPQGDFSYNLTDEKGNVDAKRLNDVLSKLTDRITQLETRAPQQVHEYEFSVTATSTVFIEHNMGTPVRWWITWFQSDVITSPNVVQLAADPPYTLNRLVLRFSGGAQASRYVIRVEPAVNETGG